MMTARSPRAPTHRFHRVVASFVFSIVAAAFVAGCSLTRPAPVKTLFLIAPPAPPAAAKTHPVTLRVGTINVAAPFRGRTFIYRDAELRFQTDYYSEFLVAPAAMIGEVTASALDRAGVFVRVVPPGARPDGDYVLDGFVSALYGDVREAGKPAAEVTVTFYLSRAVAGMAAPMWSREYHRRVPLTPPVQAPESFAAALSAAFGEIYVELVRDLGAVNLESK